MSSNIDSRGLILTVEHPDVITLFESAVSHLAGWSGNPVSCIEEVIRLDSQFALAYVFRGIVEFHATSPGSHPVIQECLKHLDKIGTDRLTRREIMHVDAFRRVVDGDFDGGASVWEEILELHPGDLMAIKFLHDIYFYMGKSEEIRSTMKQILKIWKKEYPNDPGLANIMGMYAFGLEETNHYEKAEKMGRAAVEKHPGDAWAIHAVAHVLEEQTKIQEGIEWLDETNSGWKDCGLSRHNHWHRGVYYLDLMQYDRVLDIFDAEVWSHPSSSTWSLIDASSLLYRCQIAGMDVKDRWASVVEHWMPHIDDHVLAFNDIHMMLSLMGSGNFQLGELLLEKMEEYSCRHSQRSQAKIISDLGIPISESAISFSNGKFSKVIQRLVPIRSEFSNLGGSRAQRDIFDRLLIASAIRSDQLEDHMMAMQVLEQRLECRPHSPALLMQYDQCRQLIANVASDMHPMGKPSNVS
eukprot:TRINITY_DN6044_c0_g1_i1.p1 TRINITY_DN6044_c0_g1~~TRINITY_DN6044_c0_g1_i1.p1  ORF type:complete len:468 (+),score=109.09 TRINITY_DN6044_c0_g1_i1:298-1701(+)